MPQGGPWFPGVREPAAPGIPTPIDDRFGGPGKTAKVLDVIAGEPRRILQGLLSLPQRALEGGAQYKAGSGDIENADKAIGPAVETALNLLGVGTVMPRPVSSLAMNAIGKGGFGPLKELHLIAKNKEISPHQAQIDDVIASMDKLLNPEKTDIHVGEPISKTTYGDTYVAKEGGAVKFVYNPDGTPSHATIVDSADNLVDIKEPHEINFPPKAPPENVADLSVVHIGEPIETTHAGTFSQSTYETPDGGTVEFMYDKEGKPSHAVVWDHQEEMIADLQPNEVYFPPKASVKESLHTGEPTFTGQAVQSYKTADGNNIDFHYDYNTKEPAGATVYSSNFQKTIKNYQPGEIEFPEKINPDYGSPNQVPSKPTLHIEAPYNIVQDSGGIENSYTTVDGEKITFSYNSKGKPLDAWISKAGATDNEGLKVYTPDQITFPKPIGKSGSTKDLSFPSKPFAHKGDVEFSKSGDGIEASGTTAEGNPVYYHYDEKGKPLYAYVYKDKSMGSYDKLGPDEVGFPSAKGNVEKAYIDPSKATIHEGKPKYAGVSLDSYKTIHGGSVDFYYDPITNAPDHGIVIDKDGNAVGKITPEDTNFPPKANSKPYEYNKSPDEEYEDQFQDPEEPDYGSDDSPDEGDHAALAKLHPEWKDIHSRFAEEETRIVSDYTGTAYKNINSVLAGKLKFEEVESYVPENIARLDSVMAKSRLPNDEELYRGVRRSVWDEVKGLKPGDTWTHVPFMSTSKSKSTAYHFSDSSYGGVIKVITPKGSKGVAAAPISQHPNEGEFILNRNNLLEVVSTDIGNKTITMKVVNKPSKGDWTFPSEANLQQEYDVEYLKHFKPLMGDLFVNFKSWRRAISRGKITEITPEMDKDISNRSRTASKSSLINLIKGYASYPKFRSEATVENLFKRIEAGEPLDMPLIFRDVDGSLTVVAGNTRMDAAFQSGVNPKAIIFESAASSPRSILNAK